MVLADDREVLVDDELPSGDPLPVGLRIVLPFAERAEPARQLELLPSGPAEAPVRTAPDARADVERKQEIQADPAADSIVPAALILGVDAPAPAQVAIDVAIWADPSLI